MRKLFMSDRFLKVISVVVAIIIWIYIIVVIDPGIEVKVRDLPIQFVGTDALEERGLSVISESATTISMKVKGSRKKMGNNNMETIIAKANVGDITKTGTTSVPVEIAIPFENSGITDRSLYSVDVKVEPLTHKTIKIDVNTEGSLAADYMVGPIDVNPSEITISGPESIIGNIMSAKATLNYKGADVDFEQDAPIKLYDADGKELSSLDTILTRIDQDIKSTKIKCIVVKLKKVKVVPLLNFDENSSEGENLSYNLNPETVQIYGDTSVTAKVNSLTTEAVSVEKLTENKKAKAKLVIPQGVKVLEDISEVEISIKEKTKQN